VFWPCQEAVFEATERNNDALHATIAHKLILDALHHPCGCFPGARFLKSAFESKKRKEKEGRGERGEQRPIFMAQV
jgi:hypothetical protein